MRVVPYKLLCRCSYYNVCTMYKCVFLYQLLCHKYHKIYCLVASDRRKNEWIIYRQPGLLPLNSTLFHSILLYWRLCYQYGVVGALPLPLSLLPLLLSLLIDIPTERMTYYNKIWCNMADWDMHCFQFYSWWWLLFHLISSCLVSHPRVCDTIDALTKLTEVKQPFYFTVEFNPNHFILLYNWAVSCPARVILL